MDTFKILLKNGFYYVIVNNIAVFKTNSRKDAEAHRLALQGK